MLNKQTAKVAILGGPIKMVLKPQDGTEAGITIAYDKTNDRWSLECDDFVANVWVEYYTELSHALLRLGVLARCAETNWGSMFVDQSPLGTGHHAFEFHAEQFLKDRSSSAVIEQ